MLKVLFDVLMTSSVMFLLMLVLMSIMMDMVKDIDRNKVVQWTFSIILLICAILIVGACIIFSVILFKETCL